MARSKAISALSIGVSLVLYTGVFAGSALADALSDTIAAAIANPSRPDADREKDASRHPAELLSFMGIKSGDVVIDFFPGGGYWTRLFSKIVGPKGHVIAWVPQEIAAYKDGEMVATARKTTSEPGLENVEVLVQPIDASTIPQGTIDLVWTFENYHDLHDKFMQGGNVAAFDKSIFRALKPTGVFAIGDHAAAAGSGLSNTEDLHRIDPAEVKSELAAAGFALAKSSDMLANPEDPHTAKVFDPALRGHTDRFVFAFKKP